MSVHSELGNLLKNVSGNAPSSIQSRTGEAENGDEYFDIQSAAEPSQYDVVVYNEQSPARKKFLIKYFALLKERLNRFEFEYIKQLYSEGQAENVICENLGLNPKKFKKALQSKLSSCADDIAELVAESDWDDAELFTQCFLNAPRVEEIKDFDVISFLPKTVKGFGNLIERLAYRRYRKIYKHGWFQRRKFTKPRPVLNEYTRKIKQRVGSIAGLVNCMSYDRLLQFLTACGAEPNKEDMELFERFYRSSYAILADSVSSLYKIIVEGVPVEEIEQTEAARYAERQTCNQEA